MKPISLGEYEVYAVYEGHDGLLIDYEPSTSNIVTFTTYDKYEVELFADGKNETTIEIDGSVIISNKVHPIDHASGSINYTLQGSSKTRTMRVGSGVNMSFSGPGTYIYTASYEGDNSHGSAKSNPITIHVIKKTPNISVQISENPVIGQKISINTTVPKDATGNITYYINGKERKTLDIGEIFTYTPLSQEDLNLTVIYNGNINYSTATYNTIINAKDSQKTAVKTTLEINNTNIYLGDSITVKVLVKDVNNTIITGKVRLTIGSDRFENLNIGEELKYTPTTSGNLKIYASYNGDENYEASESDIETITVNKLNPNLLITLNTTIAYINDKILIGASLVNDATKEVNLYINGNQITTISNTKTYTYTPKNIGSYNITAVYPGDDKYAESSSNTFIEVINEGSFVLKANNSNELTVNYGDIIRFESIIKPETENGQVNLFLNDVNTGITKFKANDYFDYNVSSLGDLNFKATYNYNGKILTTIQDVIVHVKGLEPDLNLILNKTTILIGENITITPIVTYGNTILTQGIISYYVGDVKIGESNAYDDFTFNPANTGRFVLNAIYSGNDIYTNASHSIYFVVNTPDEDYSNDTPSSINGSINDNKSTNNSNPVKTIITGDKVGNNFIITLKTENNAPLSGKSVTFMIKTESKSLLTNSNGQATFNIEDLDVGEYSAVCIFQGDDNYLSSSYNTYISVSNNENNNKTILLLNHYKGIYAEGGNFTGRLLDNEGNPVLGQHINLILSRVSSGASKEYDVVSDFNGDFFLPINLAPGYYTVVGYYEGLNYSNFFYPESDTIKANIMVLTEEDNKTSVVIETEEYNNTYPGDGLMNKDFKGTIKTENGDLLVGYTLNLRLIRLRVDGSYGASKTYYTVADYKGEFSLQIALAPGNYKVISSFSGSDIYAASFNDESLTIIRS